jgi:hypothetical protein
MRSDVAEGANASPASALNLGTSERTRTVLAYIVVLLGAAGILALSATAIALASDRQTPGMIRIVLVAVLPLIGTWVGTVLAFYFASHNLQVASAATREATESAARLAAISAQPTTLVDDVMIRNANITRVTLKAGQKADDVQLKDVLGGIRSLKGGDSEGRTPIMDAQDHVFYIVHASVLSTYCLSEGKTLDTLDDADTITKLKTHADLAVLISAIEFVPTGATVADAKTKMKAKDKCADVFVTDDGTANGRVLGWLTNSDLAEVSE